MTIINNNNNNRGEPMSDETIDLIDDILGSVDPLKVNAPFITAAVVKYKNGTVKKITGTEFFDIIRNSEREQVKEASLALDVTRMKKAVIKELNELNDLISKYS